MNQNKYSRLLQTLNQCSVNNADKLVSDFKQFMKYQKINKDIDNMIEQAHEKKISNEEFKSMIDEQKEIMKGLGVRNIKFKEPPSSIKKPNLNVLENESTKLTNQGKNIKVFNITEITTYNLEGDKYIFYGPNNQLVDKIRLESGEVKNVSELSKNQKEDISESINSSSNEIIIKPINVNKPTSVKPDKPKPKIEKPKLKIEKPKPKVDKPKPKVDIFGFNIPTPKTIKINPVKKAH